MVINALAGSGKSSTACLLTEHTGTSDVYLAFNASVAEEFKHKIKNPKTKVYTMHSLGYSIMNYNLGEKAKGVKSAGFGVQRTETSSAKLDNYKIHKIIDEELNKKYGRYIDFTKRVFYKDQYFTLYNLCRLTMTSMVSMTDVNKLIQDHCIFESFEEDVERPDIADIIVMLKAIDYKSLKQFDDSNVIDFTDMLYITYLKIKNKEWEVPFWHLYTNIYLDEAQDNSKLQLNFLYLIKRKNGRYIIILDKNQAIYMFSGGDAQAFSNIPKMFAPIKEFDLPICYRCAKSHLAKVNRDFGIPIKPRENAPEGFIKKIEKNEIAKYAKAGDMVISRKNKWLGSVILDLAKASIPVYIEDKELVANIKKVVTGFKCTTIRGLKSNLNKSIEEFNKKATEIIQKKTSDDNQNQLETKIEELTTTNARIDNMNFTLEILNGYLENNPPSTSVDRFSLYLTKLLNTTPSPSCVRVCSVHKSKGLEAPNVFVLNEGKVCFDFRNSKEQNIQEKNLSYISITRAENGLYLVKENDA